ncbi:23S rRNA pseudouridine(955/2504/2580) synthase RluC [Gilvimarinus sp. SDUM040013]|uniref:Pseudouridine synthase n=1 Tax=Gilvimarinus gilvus TaxID=3058038 RepID=A0ABU4RYP1_9GAMM|nr:23S rRNA pseudouridine(955/2504/2580) synthase RluC [Gilvimarinus sp. SDUM040013]MDO3385727.1 23S rRNA pseudouridine(955/2504/2580) synthase RluC [Gilvimarinus sp. SDUM040013]MDX6849366.1 23S rRNA pseudouridine(955/2504/2580) synthase RluC [Gilvimarinus sp. SDUM040013]
MTSQPKITAELDERFSRVQYLPVDDELAGQRIDNFLVARLKGVPRTHVYKLLRKGEVRVNKGRIKAGYRLKAGDTVRVPPMKVAKKAPPKRLSHGLGRVLNEAILYEDDGMLVVNKPSGIAVHGGSGVDLGLIEALRQLRPDARYLELVHRLDRDTSGCIMVAKKRSYLRHLQQCLRDKTAGADSITKVYQALAVGSWPKSAFEVKAPLLKMELAAGRERIVKVHPEGKRSLTRFKVLQRFDGFTLLEARPVTGRTHQIRVHAQYKQCPLLGDEKYGRDDVNERMRRCGAKRLFLHASSLTFALPHDRGVITVEAPLADDLQCVVEQLQEI